MVSHDAQPMMNQTLDALMHLAKAFCQRVPQKVPECKDACEYCTCLPGSVDMGCFVSMMRAYARETTCISQASCTMLPQTVSINWLWGM